MDKKSKNVIKTILKVGFTFLALFFVFSKVNIDKVLIGFSHSDSKFLILAFIFFNLSKILSSIRLNIYFCHIGLKITQLYALRLYYIGMFYNLFLPTGIGGDGYKIYLLNRFDPNIGIKKFITATLLDRISGLVPLIFFAGLLFLISVYHNLFFWLDIIVAVGVIVAFPALYLLIFIAFRYYLSVFWETTFMGGSVQLLQLVSAFFIVYAIGAENNLIVFLTIFLLSSVIAVLPLSIGGIGMREITFIYGLGFLSLPADTGVVFSLLFFCITALSSFIGILLKSEP
ncbi:MAG: lysylphosphatidylglycerol synthase transmembrane domain-containing protein [Sulfurovaceae bacterium]|nr:lysylphosphatidylglycerol synthase transmembrane domain-containing protein [Sulfurovaceae bacterium]